VAGKLDDPEWRRERARKAGLARWARADRKAESDAARARFYARFADSPDPDAALPAAVEATEAPQADTS
jgi:hypothetical protein